MPCDDVTESIEIVLDSGERVKSYSLTKKTCGGAVGTESLLIERVRGETVDDLLEMEELDILKIQLPGSDAERFLTLKHFFGIRSVLEAYIGHRPAGADSTCAIAKVDFDGADTIVRADIDVALLTEHIIACAHCGPG